jgi:hypothetical protein
MTKTIENLFVYLLFLTDILYVFLYFISINKNKSEKGLTALVIYCILDLVVNYMAEVAPRPYVFISYAVFTTLEYTLFAYILWQFVANNTIRKIISLISVAYIIFLAGYYLTSKPRSIDSIPIGIETILLLLYSFYYLYEQMNNTANLFIYNKYQFWIVTGIMIYLSGSFFIYIFANQIDKGFLIRYWFLTNAFYVIKNVFFAIGILIHMKQRKPILPRNSVLI